MTLGVTHGWTSKRINNEIYFKEILDGQDLVIKFLSVKTDEVIEERRFNRDTQRNEARNFRQKNTVIIYKDRHGQEHQGKRAKILAEIDKEFYRRKGKKKA